MHRRAKRGDGMSEHRERIMSSVRRECIAARRPVKSTVAMA
jgi:hypothetical protein